MSVRSASRLCPFLAVLFLFLFASTLSTAPQSDSASPWNVALNAEDSAASTVTATNECSNPHQFQIKPDHLAFMVLKGDAVFVVPAKSQHVVPVQFDTHGLKPGGYDAVLTVRCMDCKSEPTCREDHQDLHVFLTVTPALANWSSIYPDEKGSVKLNPALLWMNIYPDRKPAKH
jgi:hypothetical protein